MNLILIGLPGAGKSTLGQALATQLGLSFMDTDTLIENKHQAPLEDIVQKYGYQKLREFEAEVIQALNCQNTIIATGGSAVYAEEAIAHLKTLGPIIALTLPYEEMKNRITQNPNRGLAKPEDQTLKQLYQERLPLYQKHAVLTINTSKTNINTCLSELKQLLRLQPQSHRQP